MTTISAAMIAALLFTACGGEKKTAENNQAAAVETKGATTESFAVLTDDLGREVKLQKKPSRIVVTSASFLEPLHAVGGDVVGRPDSRTNMPEFAQNKQSIGRVYNIDVEKLIACQPDLVIINKGMNEKLLTALDLNKINAVVVEMKNYDSVKREIAMFAKITGDVKAGEDYTKKLDADIAAIIKKTPQEKKRVAILHSTAQGLSVQLESSIAGSVAKMLGFINVAQGMGALANNPDAAPYSIETLVEKNPEIIFITSMGKLDEIKASMDKTIAQNPAWQSIGAVKNGRVYYLSQERFLLSPGVHFPEAVKEMAALIYPEIFK